MRRCWNLQLIQHWISLILNFSKNLEYFFLDIYKISTSKSSSNFIIQENYRTELLSDVVPTKIFLQLKHRSDFYFAPQHTTEISSQFRKSF